MCALAPRTSPNGRPRETPLQGVLGCEGCLLGSWVWVVAAPRPRPTVGTGSESGKTTGTGPARPSQRLGVILIEAEGTELFVPRSHPHPLTGRLQYK